jgi:hypothetical protein
MVAAVSAVPDQVGRPAVLGTITPSGRLAQLVERLPYKQEVGGSSPSPPIQPKSLQSGQLGTELEFHGRLPSGVIGCTRGASRSEEADRGVSNRGGRGRSGHVHPVVTKTPLWATECGAPGLRGGSLVLPTTALDATKERCPVTPEVAGSSPVAPVSRTESDRVNSRTFVDAARGEVRHREPSKVRSRQENGDQDGDHRRGANVRDLR